MRPRPFLKPLAGAAALACLMALGGCAGGFDGIDLNGKVFDWMGVSAASQAARDKEPKLADRAPLVLPPDPNRLPEPGSGQAATVIAGIEDPDVKKAEAAKERERLHLAYCRGEIQWKERAVNPQATGANRSPYGPCPGLFSGVQTNVNTNLNKN